MFRKQFFPVLLATMMLFQPLMASAASISRLVPNGTVTLLESGTVVDKEIPLPNGILMSSNGQSLIENEGLHLVSADKTVFAIQEESTHFNLMVMEGSVDFAMSPDSKPLGFKPFFQDSAGTNPYLIPASSENVFRGTLQVTKDKATLTMSEGSLKVVSVDGQTVVNRGDTIVLAQLTPGATSNITGNPSRPTAETGWGGIAVGAASVGILGAAIAALAAGSGGGDGGGDEGSPY
ncbi:MAG: hypothetical protein RBR38_13720 [Desulfomicrobium apsheronum]|nr:hypothetical protein [Desulfomicrobium apsheronum]